MIPLATTELGTDSWITPLMESVMGNNGAYALVYTSAIMALLRFYADPSFTNCLLSVCSPSVAPSPAWA